MELVVFIHPVHFRVSLSTHYYANWYDCITFTFGDPGYHKCIQIFLKDVPDTLLSTNFYCALYFYSVNCLPYDQRRSKPAVSGPGQLGGK